MKSKTKTPMKAEPLAISYPVLGFHHANLREGFKGDKSFSFMPGFGQELNNKIFILITNVYRIVKANLEMQRVQCK
ncbi:MAG: hypothetical protein KDC59_16265 [Saprospiraceae bacterium]|nr:hypothetical protein [Saprospiraceae bacterium]HPG05750.1 hypothetical protein [Saprospiraceae bacterium]